MTVTDTDALVTLTVVHRRETPPSAWHELLLKNITRSSHDVWQFSPFVCLDFAFYDGTFGCDYSIAGGIVRSLRFPGCNHTRHAPTTETSELRHLIARTSNNSVTELHLKTPDDDTFHSFKFRVPQLQELCITYFRAGTLVDILRNAPLIKTLKICGPYDSDVHNAIVNLHHLSIIQLRGSWTPINIREMLADPLLRRCVTFVSFTSSELDFLDLWQWPPALRSNYVEIIQIKLARDWAGEKNVKALLGFIRSMFGRVRQVQLCGCTVARPMILSVSSGMLPDVVIV